MREFLAIFGVLVVGAMLGTLFGVAIGLCCEDAHVSEAKPEADEDEQICRESMSMVMAGSNQSDAQFRQRILVYEDCMESRAERARYRQDALDDEYLERLQACEQRYEEIYGAWMACAYPDQVELEEGAHARNDDPPEGDPAMAQRGDCDAGDMQDLQPEGVQGRGR